MAFKEDFIAYQDKINNMLLSYLPKKDGGFDRVVDAMAYSLMAGGKRIRPIFMMEAYMICGGSHNVIHDIMATIEMIHTYSLIHDDLPAMDNDALRRGKPTCHMVYGEDIAILAGDALLNRAYELMFIAIKKLPEPYIIEACELLSHNAGTYGMIGGQTADVLNEGKNISRDLLDYINKKKTSALIEAAFACGALAAGAGRELVEKFIKIGSNIGLAFQVQDDILDVAGDEKKTGKPAGSDLKNEKVTYVTLLGIEACNTYVSKLLIEAEALILTIDDKRTGFMCDFVRYLMNRDQ